MQGKQYQRMPKTAWLNRLAKLQDELREWQHYYEKARYELDSPAARERFDERALALDKIWHELDEPMRSIFWISR